MKRAVRAFVCLVLLVGLGCRTPRPPVATPDSRVSRGRSVPAPRAIEPEVYRARVWLGPNPGALRDNWIEITTAAGERGQRMCQVWLERELSRQRALGWSFKVGRACSLAPLAPAEPAAGSYWLVQTMWPPPDPGSPLAMFSDPPPPQPAGAEALVLLPSHRFSVFPSKAACEQTRDRLVAAQAKEAAQSHADEARWLDDQLSKAKQNAGDSCAQAEVIATRCAEIERSYARAACSPKDQSDRCAQLRFDLTSCGFERQHSRSDCKMAGHRAQMLSENRRTMDRSKSAEPAPECRPRPR